MGQATLWGEGFAFGRPACPQLGDTAPTRPLTRTRGWVPVLTGTSRGRAPSETLAAAPRTPSAPSAKPGLDLGHRRLTRQKRAERRQEPRICQPESGGPLSSPSDTSQPACLTIHLPKRDRTFSCY